MAQPAQSILSPWIESVILSYGSQEGSGSRERLVAHVIGVGHMSQSQAQGSKGPTGLLFLSDGELQIPAILTVSAWEHLQEMEDRECFASLVNTTVHIQDYRLQFHMATERTKCIFFISIAELATTAAGPVKDNTPCCMTWPSVRMKTSKTWEDLLGQEDSQKSQCGFDLSELLGEWQHDCLQAVLQDIRERLTMVSSRPVSPQPSTSTSTSTLTHSDTFTPTTWDVDRVRYKAEKGFSVPMRCLLIPEEDAQQLQTPSNVDSRTPSGLSAATEDRNKDAPQVCKPSETTQPSVDDAGAAIVKADSPPHMEDSMLQEYMCVELIGSDIRPLSNPWDIFPPPCASSSSSDASPEATPAHSPHNPCATVSKPDHAAILTSTQLPVHSSKESQQTSEHSKGEHSSYLLPYQKPPQSTSLPNTSGSSAVTSVSPPEPFTTPSNLSPATDKHHTDTAQPDVFEKDMKEIPYRKPKRKRSEPSPEALTTLAEKEAQIDGSPPSWLFDSEAGSASEEGSSHQQDQTVGTVLRETCTVHCDGRPFSYVYQVSGQNLQDFSQFKVAESLLQWAVAYLVGPEQKDKPHVSNPQ